MDKDQRRPDSKYTFLNDEMLRKEEERSHKAEEAKDEDLGGASKASESKA